MRTLGTRKIFCLLGVVLLATTATAGDFEISDAWARAPAPGQQVVGVYFTIFSDHGGRLIKLSSPVAKSTELHHSQIVNNVMQMRQVLSMDVLPKHAITLAPNGAHAMLLDVSKKLSAGDMIPMIATFEDQQKKKIKVKFKAVVKSE